MANLSLEYNTERGRELSGRGTKHGASLQTPQTLGGAKGGHLENWKLPDREGLPAAASLRPEPSGHGARSRSVPRLHAEVLLQPLAPGNGRQPSSRTLTLASRFLFTARPLGIPPNVTGIMALAMKRCSWVFIKNFLFFDGRKFFPPTWSTRFLVQDVNIYRGIWGDFRKGNFSTKRLSLRGETSPGFVAVLAVRVAMSEQVVGAHMLQPCVPSHALRAAPSLFPWETSERRMRKLGSS